MPPDGERKIRTNQYDSENHFLVLCKMQGSVLPKVLPFCIVNTLLAGFIFWMNKSNDLDLTCSDEGHLIMTFVVSFLLVKSVRSTLARIDNQRTHLSQCYQAMREFMQHSCIITSNQQDDEAKQWRQEIAYRAMILLRVTVAMLESKKKKQNAWDIPELDEEERKCLRNNLILEKSPQVGGGGSNEKAKDENISLRWAHGERCKKDENLRTPIRIAHRLRTTVVSQRNRLQKNLLVQEEQLLLGFIQKFMVGYFGLAKYATAPQPFPLVQMSRTFLLFFVYTLPFVVVSNDISKITQEMVFIFLITYGFLGLEYVAILLTDPFGDGPNDFDALGWAYFVYEDIYITIGYTDGPEYADRLRHQMNGDISEKSGRLSESALNERTHLLDHSLVSYT